VQALEHYDFSDTDIALFSPGASVSKIYAPIAAAAGCVVIDNTSQFRMDPEIPLVVPEVNSEALRDFRKRNIIANPNCSTMQMVVALKPLHDAAGIKRIVVSTYQSVSGAGKAGMDELYDQTKQLYMNENKEPQKFTKRIAFNVIPHIDVFMEDGSTKEEWKMVEETKKILDPNIAVSATCVRVPVFVGHSESVNLEFEDPITPEQAREILSDAEGVILYDEKRDAGYCTPIECAGEDAVFVSRIRKDASVENGLAMWIVSDNLRKGAALNAVQIAEELVENYGLAPKKAH
jgi:aspartate-semialdehyde dehydrogenase